MWMLFARAPPPDAPYWPGRRWLAAIDAVMWPGAVWGALQQMPYEGGLVLVFLTALVGVSAARRLSRAQLRNHRYQFTTWRWARVSAWMMAIGALLRYGLPG